MGDALGSVGSGLQDTGAGIRDFLAGPGSAQQPIPAQILNSVLGALLAAHAPGVLVHVNEQKQAALDTNQHQLDQYLGTPSGQDALAQGATGSLASLFPGARLPSVTPVEAGPFPPGVPIVATGPPGGPTTGVYVLPPTPESIAVGRAQALTHAQDATFPIGAYQPARAQFQISDSGEATIQGQVTPRKDTEMLVPSDEIQPENLAAQGLSAIETRFADARGVPLVLLQQDKAAAAARVQAAKTAVVEASQLRRIAATGDQTRQNIDFKESLVRERPEKPAKKPAPKAGDFRRRVVDALLKKKLKGAAFTPQEAELYDKLIAKPSLYDSLLGGAPALPASGTTAGGVPYQKVN